ncbi:MAG: GGDEF domain-containing protein [Planctomycetes bacterium]|nr:GGDEF domain-containing protein [Planctomycetota bacterium]
MRDERKVVRSLSLISQAINSSVSLEQVLRLIAIEAVGLVDADVCAIMLLDDTRQRLVFCETYGLTREEVERISFRVGEGIAGWVAERGLPALVDDVSLDARWVPKDDQATATRSLLCVPMEVAERPIGVINLSHSQKTGAFDEADKDVVILLANHIAQNIEKYRLYELSITDPLTGVFNYRYFQHQLEKEFKRVRRYKGELAVVMVDIDHFKRLNDTRGHPAGDRVLREMAEVLRGNVREVDTLARYGGEEFVVVLPATGRSGAVEIAERICNTIDDHPFRGDGSGTGTLHVTVSLGGAVWTPDVVRRDELVRRADSALYQAKKEGRNRVVFV